MKHLVFKMCICAAQLSLSISSFLPGDDLYWKAYKKDKMKINFKITGMCRTKVALSWTSFAVSLLIQLVSGKQRTFIKHSQNHFGEELHCSIDVKSRNF